MLVAAESSNSKLWKDRNGYVQSRGFGCGWVAEVVAVKRHQELPAPCHTVPVLDSSKMDSPLAKAKHISDHGGPHARAGGDVLKKAEACRETMLEL
ncbi:hypothetical protein BTVI_136726 [Pitangus sulphuratus]|nr:hypothetical protein BTVI_136726 [Pitangus sulphuratus]